MMVELILSHSQSTSALAPTILLFGSEATRSKHLRTLSLSLRGVWRIHSTQRPKKKGFPWSSSQNSQATLQILRCREEKSLGIRCILLRTLLHLCPSCKRSCDLELALSFWTSVSSSEKMQIKPVSQGSCEDPKDNVCRSAWYTLNTETFQ